jgi:hypothetical protein
MVSALSLMVLAFVGSWFTDRWPWTTAVLGGLAIAVYVYRVTVVAYRRSGGPYTFAQQLYWREMPNGRATAYCPHCFNPDHATPLFPEEPFENGIATLVCNNHANGPVRFPVDARSYLDFHLKPALLAKYRYQPLG